MKSLKYLLEKPYFITAVIFLIYGALFLRGVPDPAQEETHTLWQLTELSQAKTFPTLQSLRELKDWGHVGFYVVAAQVLSTLKGDVYKLHIFMMVVAALALFVLMQLGLIYTYKNRLTPAWVSAMLIITAANPYFWQGATTVNYMLPLLLVTLSALWAFEKEHYGMAALFGALAVSFDWIGLVLPIAIGLSRLSEERGRVIRPLRILSYGVPLAVAVGLYAFWSGFIPQGEARTWYDTYKNAGHPVFRLDQLIYSVALLPLYTLWFSWSWAFKSRLRALTIAGILAGVLTPLFFATTINIDLWSSARFGLDLPLGVLDVGAGLVAGEYKNFAFVLPFAFGLFFLGLLTFMDVLDQSRCLRLMILMFFMAQPFVIGGTERAFLFIVPFICLFSLSEALVGEEGNLTRV